MVPLFNYFNRQFFTHLGKSLTLDQKYDMLDPKLMIRDSVYPTYGSVGICSLLQHSYRYFAILNIFTKIFPALPSAHESNVDGYSG